MNTNKLLKGEFIGKNIEIISGNSSGVSGEVIFETMNTFKILNTEKCLIIPKAGNKFRIAGSVIEGNKIMFRPEDRIKKIR